MTQTKAERIVAAVNALMINDVPGVHNAWFAQPTEARAARIRDGERVVAMILADEAVGEPAEPRGVPHWPAIVYAEGLPPYMTTALFPDLAAAVAFHKDAVGVTMIQLAFNLPPARIARGP